MATVIFAISMAGLVGVFVAGKRNILHSRERITGSEMGKFFLDPFQLYVRQDTWDTSSNALTTGTTYCDSSGSSQNPSCPSVGSNRSVNNVSFSSRYDVSTVSGTSLRKVKAKISWSEFSP